MTTPDPTTPDPATPAFSAVLAMATYRRPDHLRRILPLLVKQAVSAPVPVRVVVVDNDPAGGARDLVGEGVEYVHEPEPGIAAARNAALDAASGADVIVFLDDDEEPVGAWLTTLLSAWEQWRCAGVAGPVESRFTGGDPDPWAVASGLFDTVRRPTGMVLPGAASNNLLLDLNVLRGHGIRFDQRFGLSGGSDTMLTHTLIKAGEQLRWCAEALVIDLIPADRSTPAWVRNRVRRQSNSWARVKLETGSRRPWLVAQAVKLIVRGVVSRSPKGACDVMRGVGVLDGVMGSVRSEYLR